MTDLTPIFSQCVSIVTNELPAKIQCPAAPPRPYLVVDTFLAECAEVYINLVRLATFISEIRLLYLQVNDEFSRLDHGRQRELSLADKQSIDEEFKLKIQRVYEKLKLLQQYERKRVQILEKTQNQLSFISKVFSTGEEEPLAIYHATLAAHRTQILRFLSITTHTVNASFEQMQKQRFGREKQLNLLHIQNLDDTEEFDGLMDDFGHSASAELDDGGHISQELTQEQVQELLLENAELLHMKTNQFKQVEQLHHSMVDIVKLQTELTMHLETQGLQIDTLLDNQDQIGVDLRGGNRDLARATNRNKRGSNVLVTTCVVLGVLLLFVDYIS